MAAVLLAFAAASLSAAQEPAPQHRPEVGRRTARHFDFEEATTNPLPLPRHWSRLVDDSASPRGAYPPYNRVELDYTTARAGEGSVRLRARSGGVALRLDPGVIPVFPGGDYLVTAQVRTNGALRHRAFISGRFLDGRAAPIAASERVSAPLLSEGEWHEVSLQIRGEWPEAAFLQLELSLLPPRRFEPSAAAPDPHRVWLQDADASAWFDDVTVVQVPRLELTTEAPANIIAAPHRPRVRLTLRDLAGEPMRAHFTLHDSAGVLVDEADLPVPGGHAHLTWEPRTARLGWYRAATRLRTADHAMGEAHVAFACVPHGDGNAADVTDPRLRLAITSVPAGQWADLPALVAGAGVASVSLPIWGEDLTADGVDALLRSVETAFHRFRNAGCIIAFSLPRSPRIVSEQTRTSPDNPAAAIAAAGDHWKPLLLPFLDEYGQAVPRWQIGAGAGGPGAIPSKADLEVVRGIISLLVPGPWITLGWHADTTPDPSLWSGASGVDSLCILLPQSAPVFDTVRRILDETRSAGSQRPMEFSLDPAESHFSLPQDAADNLIRRVVEALGAGAGGVSVAAPWQWTGQPSPQSMPTAPYAALSNLAQVLRGRRVAERLDLHGGVSCFLLDPEPRSNRSAAMVLWRSSPDSDEAAIVETPLGLGSVEVLDRWGNASTLAPEPLPSGSIPPHRLTVTGAPVFVEGVDSGLLRLLASLRLDPAFLATDESEHRVTLHLANPWGSGIAGRVLVREPDAPQSDSGYAGSAPPERPRRDWTITPRTQQFNIAAGEAADLPLTLAFLPSQESGPHELSVELDIAGPQTYSGLTARVPFVIGMRGISVEVTCRRGPSPSGPDAIVEATITNESDRAAALEAIAFAPGHPRAAAPRANLGPGEQTSRRFTFPGAGQSLRGRRVYISIRDADTGARLTRSIQVH